jgi:hypothetical protein
MSRKNKIPDREPDVFFPILPDLILLEPSICDRF